MELEKTKLIIFTALRTAALVFLIWIGLALWQEKNTWAWVVAFGAIMIWTDLSDSLSPKDEDGKSSKKKRKRKKATQASGDDITASRDESVSMSENGVTTVSDAQQESESRKNPAQAPLPDQTGTVSLSKS